MYSFFKAMNHRFDSLKVTQRLEDHIPVEMRGNLALKIAFVEEKYYCKHEGGITFENGEVRVHLNEKSDSIGYTQPHIVVLSPREAPKVQRRVGSDENTNSYAELVLAALVFIADRDINPPEKFFQNNAQYIGSALEY